MPNIAAPEVDTGDPSEKSQPAAATAGARERFLARWREAAEGGSLHTLVLAKPTSAPGDDVQRVTVRPILWHAAPALSVVWSHPTRDITRNLALAPGVEEVGRLVGEAFAHAHLHAGTEQWQLRRSRHGRYGLVRGKAAAPQPEVASGSGHDRVKRRLVDIGRPWLQALGVTDAEGRLIPAMARKWKQINKFIEVFDAAFTRSVLAGRERVHVVDFGAGKGYLTFALHDHLRRTLGVGADVTGVELRPDLVELCNGAAQRGGHVGLRFVEGDVRTHAPPALDVMIALHACDTATDHALHAGIRAGAAVILCSPCCHKELRPQMQSPTLLRPMLQHGIHLGQQAEMVTDSLRALLLEAEGYASQVFEFVALEHTSKNKMILALKRDGPRRRDGIEAQIREIKAFYGIRSHCLETLLGRDVAEGAPGTIA